MAVARAEGQVVVKDTLVIENAARVWILTGLDEGETRIHAGLASCALNGAVQAQRTRLSW